METSDSVMITSSARCSSLRMPWYGFHKLMLENRCNLMEKEMVEMRNNATHNQIHLIEYMRYTEYLKDKVNRMWGA